MAYTFNTKFIQLTPYLLMEYMYSTSGTPEGYNVNSAPAVGYEKIVNGYYNGALQVFNGLNSDSITGNTRLRSVVRKADNRFVSLTPNRITQYLDTDPKLTSVANLPVTFPNDIFVTYDKVRFHIVSGYGFENNDGIIMRASYPEVSTKYATVLQIILEKGDIDTPVINPNPIYLSGAVYDKYIEVKIPSFYVMNQDFDALTGSSLQANTLAAKISSDGRGFLKNSPVFFQIHEIIETVTLGGYDNYTTTSVANYSLPAYDAFTDLAANLNENTDYSYIEYWPSWQGDFLEDFLNIESSLGNNYYAINDIEVKEQVGNTYYTTATFTTIQNDSFNAPLYFRPVMKNGNTTSFLVNYTIRLFNKRDSTQILRRATLTSFNANRYGRNLQRLALNTVPSAQKVYNKIVDAPKISSTYNLSQNNPGAQSVGIPIFYDFRQVSVTKDDLTVQNTGGLALSSNISDTTVALGQGRCQVIVTPFDNYYRFRVFNTVQGKESIPIDLGGTSDYYLVFIGDRDQSVRVGNLKGVSINNPSKGELAFKTVEQESKKILGFSNREFHIVSRSVTGTETSIYVGSWVKSTETSGLTGTTSTTSTTSTTTPTGTGAQGGNTRFTTLNAIQANEGIPVTTDLANRSGLFGPTINDYFGGTGSVRREVVPVSGTGTTGQFSTTSNVPNPNVDIPTLAQFIRGNESLGMTPQVIADYFLKQGNPGYNVFKGITKNDFLRAVDQVYPKTNGVNNPRYNTYANYLGVPLNFDVRTNR